MDVEEVIDTLQADNAKLRRFKEYVHARLDAAGIPTHPHSAEGCRVGDRLDLALAGLDLLRDMDAYEDFGELLQANVPQHYEQPDEINQLRLAAYDLLQVCSDKAQQEE